MSVLHKSLSIPVILKTRFTVLLHIISCLVYLFMAQWLSPGWWKNYESSKDSLFKSTHCLLVQDSKCGAYWHGKTLTIN